MHNMHFRTARSEVTPSGLRAIHAGGRTLSSKAAIWNEWGFWWMISWVGTLTMALWLNYLIKLLDINISKQTISSL